MVETSTAGYRADGGDTEGWAVRAASVPGVSHRLAGTPNEDAFGWVAVAGSVVAAVADGVGSIEGAAEASSAAVGAVCSTAAAWLQEGGEVGWPLVEAAFAEAVRLVGEGPGATTLVVAALELSGSGVVGRVGDSTALLLDRKGWHQLLEPGEEALSAGTSALSGGRDVEVEAAELAIAPGNALVLVTDGVGNPLQDGPTTVAPALAAILDPVPSPLALSWRVDFSRQGCHDDRTLLSIWRVMPTI